MMEGGGSKMMSPRRWRKMEEVRRCRHDNDGKWRKKDMSPQRKWKEGRDTIHSFFSVALGCFDI